MPNPLASLAADWCREAVTLRRRGAEAQAVVLESCAEDLEEALREWELEELSISEAAAESGYSEEHLRRLTRSNQLSHTKGNGKRGHIKVQRCDLPTKRIYCRQSNKGVVTDTDYDPEEDARDIAQRLARRS